MEQMCTGYEYRRHTLAVVERPAPAEPARGLITAELGDVHEQQAWRVPSQQWLDLDGTKSWCESSDPEFAAKAADQVGLHMIPLDQTRLDVTEARIRPPVSAPLVSPSARRALGGAP